VQFLLRHGLLSYIPSPILDKVYTTQKGPLPSSPEPTTPREAPPLRSPSSSVSQGLEDDGGETMLLSQANGKEMTQVLELPQLEVELERAIWQVETAIGKQNEKIAESGDQNSAKTAKEPPAAAPDRPTEKEQDR
jgi:hypothetical protein